MIFAGVLLSLGSVVPWWKWPAALALMYLVAMRDHLLLNHIHHPYAANESVKLCSTAEQARTNIGECVGERTHSYNAPQSGNSRSADVAEQDHCLAGSSDNQCNEAVRPTFYGSHVNCTPTPTWTGSRARTTDGTCNNLKLPEVGARFTRFARNIRPGDHFNSPRHYDLLDPNPRTVARKLLRRKKFIPVPTLNSLGVAWIQFNLHDWLDHGQNEKYAPHLVPLSDDDPLVHGGNHDNIEDGKLRILRTRRDRTRNSNSTDKLITAINNVTHWADASTIYGSSLEVERRVRSFQDGKLKVDKDGLLPVSDDGLEYTGFNDNWWTGLSLMHTLFVKEHNVVCDMLKGAHPGMDDQQLFETARLIVAATIAKIQTVEWTPSVVASLPLRLGTRLNWSGLLGPNIKKYFGHTGIDILSGLVGWTAKDHGVPFAMTEELVAIYRFHSQLRDTYNVTRVADKGQAGSEVIQLLDMTFDRHLKIRHAYSQEDLLLTFGTNTAGALALHNFPSALMDITKPDKERIDLATIDILRDRERQIPRFNHYRRSLNLVPYGSIDEITDDTEILTVLKEVYDDDVEKVDLLVGCMAESYPYEFAFSNTVFQAFIVMATRRLLGDRFFTDDFTAEYYTQEGLDWIDEVDMRVVLLRHYPSLKPALDTAPRNNAFVPWSWSGARGTKCSNPDDCDSNHCAWTSLFEMTCA